MTLKLVTSLLFLPLLTLAATAQEQTSPPYDLVLQKASHNSYARDESLFDQLVFHRVRSLALDIWQSQHWKVDTTVRERPAANVRPWRNASRCLRPFTGLRPNMRR